MSQKQPFLVKVDVIAQLQAHFLFFGIEKQNLLNSNTLCIKIMQYEHERAQKELQNS